MSTIRIIDFIQQAMPDQSSTNLSGEDTSRLLREGVPVTENSTRCDVRGVNTPLSIIYNISSK